VKKLFVFDLDGTLAESKSSLSPEVAELLHDLLGVMKVAVISGGSWAQFETQLLARLPKDDRFEDLYLLPTCGTKFYRYVDQWSKVYSEDLSKKERQEIISALKRALEESGIKVKKVWGEAIEDRGSQITLSVLGQEAPLSAKQGWDPNFAKRKKIVAILEPLLQRPGQLVAAPQLAASVWGGGFRQQANCLRFHMVQLRRKLEDNPARPRHLLTARGMGYRYQP